MNKTRRSEKKIEGKQLSILKSISNKIKENWYETYMDAKYNPGRMFQGEKVDKKKTRKITQKCCAHGNNLYGQWRKYICIM
jgi:hypothetical protein